MMEIEENELCIVCSKPGPSFYLRNNIKDDDPKVYGGVAGEKPAPKSVREMRLLRPQLRAVFLLQEVFKHSLQDDVMQETMEVLGHPSEWFEICARCRDLVDSGIDVIVQLKKYLEAHKRIVEELKMALKSSQGQPWGSEGDWILVRSETGAKPKLMERFRKAMRKEEIELGEETVVKKEPVDCSSNDGDSQYSSYMVQSPTESITPFDLHEVKQEADCSSPPVPERTQGLSESTSALLRKHLLKKDTVCQQETMTTCQAMQGASRACRSSIKVKKQISSSRKRKHSNVIEKSQTATEISKKYDEEKAARIPVTKISELEGDQKAEVQEMIQTSLLLLGGPTAMERRWFYDRCHQYLDMSLFEYPSPLATETDSQARDKYFKNGTQIRFPCTSCEDTFTNKFHAIAHIQKVHMGIKRPWKCNVCAFKFVSVSTFRRHIQDHEDSSVKTCTVCGTFSCKKRVLMDTHLINHQKDVSTPTCPECKEEFVNFNRFLNHMLTKHEFLYKHDGVKDDGVKHDGVKDDGVKHDGVKDDGVKDDGVKDDGDDDRNKDATIDSAKTCQFCNKVFNSEIVLKYHLFKTHNHGERDESFPVCSKCGTVTFNELNLASHIKSVHGESRIPCDHCGKEFKSRDRLQRHVYRVHNYRLQKCHICGAEYKNSHGLHLHLRKYHAETMKMSSKQLEEYLKKNNEEMAFKCKYCSKTFAFPYPLTLHQRNDHPELRKFNCDTCGNRFLTKNALISHTKVTHLELKTKCRDCGKLVFTVRIAAHRRLNCPARKGKSKELDQDPEEGAPEIVDKLTCDICGKKFASKYSLAHHKKVVHMNWKRMCEYCGKSYTNINLHRNKHCPERRRLEEQEKAN